MARTRFAIAGLLAASLAAAPTHAETADRRPAFEVVVDNHAPAAAPEIATAQARAGFIFAEAGLRVSWLAQAAGVAAQSSHERIMLVVLDPADGNRVITGDVRRLGFAVPPAHRVYVHYARVYDLARDHGVQPGWFLGVVMAHELGHVLLPRGGHTADGIMAASLMPDPKCPPAFSREEARQLRGRLGAETLLALR